jgi:signal peptidase I
MRPNLLEGDVVFVNRLAFDLKVPLTDVILARLGEPQHGDIVTFSRPGDGTRLIKRVVALPGELVEMRDKRLYINGVAADYRLEGRVMEPAPGEGQAPALHLRERFPDSSHDIQWLANAATAPNFGPLRVPADHYLMLGDNRDRSADSRFFGLVPREALIGRAERILVSVAYQDDWSPRFERFGLSLAEGR